MDNLKLIDEHLKVKFLGTIFQLHEIGRGLFISWFDGPTVCQVRKAMQRWGRTDENKNAPYESLYFTRALSEELIYWACGLIETDLDILNDIEDPHKPSKELFEEVGFYTIAELIKEALTDYDLREQLPIIKIEEKQDE